MHKNGYFFKSNNFGNNVRNAVRVFETQDKIQSVSFTQGEEFSAINVYKTVFDKDNKIMIEKQKNILPQLIKLKSINNELINKYQLLFCENGDYNLFDKFYSTKCDLAKNIKLNINNRSIHIINYTLNN